MSELLTGTTAVEMWRAAAARLEREKARIDGLNVFPVPDGDTGTNMSRTMRAALERLDAGGGVPGGGDLSSVLSRLAEGALLGARGNSGTILSQYFQGLYEGAKGRAAAGPHELAYCLQKAFEAAYVAVETPVEGTILTVARAAAEAAAEAAAQGGGLVEVWASALERARVVLEDTPSMLPVLREAGVVDAGGEGLVVMMDGALRVLKGESLAGDELDAARPPAPAAGAAGAAEEWGEAVRDAHSRHAITASEIEYGYCTEFLIRGEGLSRDAIRSRLAPLGDSLLVVGHETLVKVHLHTNNPGLALEIGCELGRISSVSIANMWEQNEAAAGAAHEAAKPAPRPSARYGVVAVAWGAGFAELFESQGVTTLLQADGRSKPSTGEILQAIESLPQECVIVLPNSKDVLLSAQQAAKLSQKDVRVLATASEAEGVAASVAIDPQASPDDVLDQMKEVVDGLKVASLARASRDATVGGTPVQEGEYIGIAQDNVLASGFDLAAVLVDLVEALGPDPGGLVTLYYGADLSPAEVDEHLEALRARLPDVEFESYSGGRRVYQYILTVE